MSLPRNIQESWRSTHIESQQNPTGGVEYKSGGVICSSANKVEEILDQHFDKDFQTRFAMEESKYNSDFPIACSQPNQPSILADCHKSSGSLFSVVSAPPVTLAELDVKRVETLIGINPPIGVQSSAGVDINHQHSLRNSGTLVEVNKRSVGKETEQMPLKKNLILPIDCPYSPARPISRTLHASLMHHQISEVEEEDNENLLTVSSITARPLIAKSRELRSSMKAESSANEKRKKIIRNRKNKEDVNDSSEQIERPDGGYGWIIVFGAFSVQFWVAGLVKSYGVLFVEIMETFPDSSASYASWIPAILSALCLALAPLSSALCQKFSCRNVVFIGGLFCATGMTLSYFANSLTHLLVTFGILTGIGGGLSTTPGIIIVSQYFEKHRALANGICVSGTAAGSFILPVLIKHLVEKFGFHMTILILGGCMLDVCISATLYKPIEDYVPKEDIESGKSCENLEKIPEMPTDSTYLDNVDDNLNAKFIENFFLQESNNQMNGLLSRNSTAKEKLAQESDDELKDIIGETTFIKPIKKVRSSGILHSVEDLSTDSTWMYRKHSGTDSNRGSRRRRNVFANDEIISKIHNHLEQPLSSPTVLNPGISKSMEIPTHATKLLFNQHDLIHDDAIESELNYGIENDEAKRTVLQIIEAYLDISLLKDGSFILMAISVTLMSVGCPYMLYYLPSHVISIGYSKSQAGYLVSISGVLDLCGRLGLGYLSDLHLFSRRKTYIFCILGAGFAVLTIPTQQDLYLVGLSAAGYGLCLGSWYVLMPVLLADIFGTERIGSSYGLVRLFQSIGAISVPPLAGLLRDIFGNYKVCFYFMGTSMVLGSVPLIIWSLISNKNIEDSDSNSSDSS